MSKNRYILLLVTAAFFTACSTANGIPIDDAYYSPEIESPAPATTPKTEAPKTAPATQSTPAAPKQSIEYLNVQDTTVTIRIKK